MRNKIAIILTVLVIISQSFCIYAQPLDNENSPKQVNWNQKFEPPAGKTMMFIGQDTAEMDNYIEAVRSTTSSAIQIPSGFMIYTNLQTLEGMTAPYEGAGEMQAGKMDFQYWSSKYADTVLNLGIWASSRQMLIDIADGVYDDNIKKLASYVKSSDKPVYIRFGYEFDGPWGGNQRRIMSQSTMFLPISIW